MTLEVPVETLSDAVAAVRAGADRLELCASLEVGGLTPSLKTLAQFADSGPAPFVVMIRPRAGDFVYDVREADAMERAIGDAIAYHAEGVVFGVLSRNNEIDVPLCRRLIAAAGSAITVFHRAFDSVVDQQSALDQLIELGFTRILTAGGTANAASGTQQIAALIDRAAGRIEILPGGGIRPDNVAPLIRTTRCGSIHSSCRRGDAGQACFDHTLVAELRRIIDHLP